MFSIFYLFNDGITLIDFGFGQLVYLCYLRIIPGPTLWDNLLFPLLGPASIQNTGPVARYRGLLTNNQFEYQYNQ